jgi:hypothetical protein
MSDEKILSFLENVSHHDDIVPLVYTFALNEKKGMLDEKAKRIVSLLKDGKGNQYRYVIEDLFEDR